LLPARSWRGERILKLTLLPILLIILAALVAIPNLSIPPAKASSSSPWTFRDDFNYASISQLQAAGWTTESIAPASYYSVGNSILTLLNDGHVGAGAGYDNVPANVSEWSVSTRVEWIGTSGGVSSPVGSLQVAVGTVGHSYDWMADGYYGKFWIGMDGHNVANFASYAKQLNVWHVLQLDMIHGTLYGYFDGYLVGSYTEPDTTPGNTKLINVQALASWETNNNFDWMQANNSPAQPPPSPTYPYFTISANPSAIALVAGQSANSTIQLQSQANFSGTVNLSVTVEYVGLSAQIIPSTVTLSGGGSTNATLSIVSQASTPNGGNYVTVSATGGTVDASTTLTVIVNSGTADFSITESVGSIAIPVGSERQTTVTVTSINGFSGNVTLVATPSSTALHCWFTTLTNTATVAVPVVRYYSYYPPSYGPAYQYLTCSAARPAGAYSVKITGTSGSLSHTLLLNITITDFTMSGPSSISLNAGTSKTESISLTSLSGFSGKIDLTETSPSSLLSSCPESVILTPNNPSTVTCSLYSPTAGTYSFTVTGAFVCIDCYFDGIDSNSISTSVTVIGPSVSDFYIAANPSSLTIMTGSSITSTLTSTSFNGFSGSVSLSVSAPAGLTASINPTSVNVASGGTATSVLTITATSSTPTGSYNVTVTGTSGSQTHSILVTVNVVNQDFTISESPTYQAIPLGSEQQTVLDLDSVNGFSGNVNLVATPSSNAIACWFTYTLTSTATLYIPPNGSAYQYPTCGAYGAAGSYSVTFSATSGLLSHSITLLVTILDFSISASSVSFTAPSGNGTLTLNSLSGLSGLVSINVSTPSAVTASCPTSASLVSGGTTTVACTYASNIPGTYNVTITGSFVCSGCYYDGTDSHSVTVVVMVSQPSHPNFYVSANPNGLALTPGPSATSTISLTSLGFAGTVNLAASISPAGPSVSLNPLTVTLASGGTGTSTLTLSTTSTTPTGSYKITVTATSGGLAHSITLSLTVSNSGFAISESPTSQAIPLGSEMQTAIYVSSVNGFSGNVNLVATPSSTAVACWFAYTLTNKATVSVPSYGSAEQWPTCGAYGSAGSYTVTISGTSGSLNYSIVLPVTVMDYSISASSVSFTAGSSGSSTVSLTSLSGLAGPVTLSMSTPPDLTASCSSSATLSAGGTSSASCTFAATSPGTYVTTITGTFVCSGCYYDGTDSHSTTATVTVTSTDPPVGSTVNFQGITVSTRGSLTIDLGTVSGTVSVMATNSSSGTVLFSKTYTITNVQVANNHARFLLNVAAGQYPLSADVTLSLTSGVWSASVIVTRQLAITGAGTVGIVDFSVVALDYGSSLGSSRYNPAADLTGSGTIDIVDIGIVGLFYGAKVFY